MQNNVFFIKMFSSRKYKENTAETSINQRTYNMAHSLSKCMTVLRGREIWRAWILTGINQPTSTEGKKLFSTGRGREGSIMHSLYPHLVFLSLSKDVTVKHTKTNQL